MLIAAAIGFALGWFLKPTGDHDKRIPDIINLYSNGEQTEISEVNNQQLFERVLRLIVLE